MTATAEAGMLERWRRFYDLEPFGEEWLLMSVAISNVINELREVKYAIKQQDMPPSERLKENRFVPKTAEQLKKIIVSRKKKALNMMEPSAMIQLLKMKVNNYGRTVP